MSVTDDIAVLDILRTQKACEYGELKARAYKQFKITNKHVYEAFDRLKSQGKAGSHQVTIQCSFPPSSPPRFLYSLDIDAGERQLTIDEKKPLLAQHYDNTKEIGKHAELLVKMVCEDLHYKRIWQRKKVGNREIDIYCKHPSNKYWQAISVKNWRDPINNLQLWEILNAVKDARSKYKRKDIRPAIVTTVAYLYLIEYAKIQFGIPIALMEKQVAPELHRTLYESLNDKLAFDVQITDKPTDKMRKNIEEYICKPSIQYKSL